MAEAGGIGKALSQIPRLGISKCDYQYVTSPCNPHPPRLHSELIAFFDLKSQNKKGVLHLTNMSYAMSLLSKIPPEIYQDLSFPAVGSGDGMKL
jgi:hypothetical protein